MPSRAREASPTVHVFRVQVTESGSNDNPTSHQLIIYLRFITAEQRQRVEVADEVFDSFGASGDGAIWTERISYSREFA